MKTLNEFTFDLGKAEISYSFKKDDNLGMTFSASGGIWNKAKTDFETCGQIIDQVLELYPHHKGVQELYLLWKAFHLNDMSQTSIPSNMRTRIWNLEMLFDPLLNEVKSEFETLVNDLLKAEINHTHTTPDGVKHYIFVVSNKIGSSHKVHTFNWTQGSLVSSYPNLHMLVYHLLLDISILDNYTLDDFAEEFGYTKPSEAIKVYSEIQTNLVKLKELVPNHSDWVKLVSYIL